MVWRSSYSNIAVKQNTVLVSIPTSCFKARSSLRSDQVAQGFTQLGLENLQGGNLSGQPLPLIGSPRGGKVSPCIWTESLVLQFMSVLSWSPVMHCCKKPGFISSVTPCRCWRAVVRLPKDIPSPGWASPSPLASPWRPNAPAPTMGGSQMPTPVALSLPFCNRIKMEKLMGRGKDRKIIYQIPSKAKQNWLENEFIAN